MGWGRNTEISQRLSWVCGLEAKRRPWPGVARGVEHSVWGAEVGGGFLTQGRGSVNDLGITRLASQASRLGFQSKICYLHFWQLFIITLILYMMRMQIRRSSRLYCFNDFSDVFHYLKSIAYRKKSFQMAFSSRYTGILFLILYLAPLHILKSYV